MERYRREAAHLRGVAEAAQDAMTREQLLDIARQYETLATSIERLPCAPQATRTARSAISIGSSATLNGLLRNPQ